MFEPLTDERIRATVLGDGHYWIGELNINDAGSDPPEWMPRFRNVAKAARLKTLRDMVDWLGSGCRDKSHLGFDLRKRQCFDCWNNLKAEIERLEKE